jgi:hypothetical protein
MEKTILINSSLDIHTNQGLKVNSFHEYNDSVGKTCSLVGRLAMSSIKNQRWYGEPSSQCKPYTLPPKNILFSQRTSIIVLRVYGGALSSSFREQIQ